MKDTLELRVLIYPDGEQWVAQMLEKDLAAHGETEYTALTAICLVLQAHVNFDTLHKRPPLSRLRRAPEVFFSAYREATPLSMPDETHSMPADIKPAVKQDALALH